MAHNTSRREVEAYDPMVTDMKAFQKTQDHRQRHSAQHAHQTTTSEYDSHSSDNETNSQSEGSSRKTPSEYSLPTPEDEQFQPEIDQFYFGMDVESATLASTKSDRPADEGAARKRHLTILQPMLASLTSHSDFNFDRFSAYYDIPKPLEITKIKEEHEFDYDLELEDEDLYASIEIVKPVAIAMQRGRPMVIEIPSPKSTTFSRPFQEDNRPQRPSVESSRRSSEASSYSKFSKAQEHAQWCEDEDDVYVPAAHTQSSAFPRRVSSVSSNTSSTSRTSRMNSLKNFIRSTSNQLLEIKEEAMSSSKSPTAQEFRPVSSKRTVRDFDIGAFITSPPVPSKLPALPDTLRRSPSLSKQRKKSFSNLRSRSGSIGETLKQNLGSSPKPLAGAVPPLPTLPSLVIPTRSTSRRHPRDNSQASTVPVLTPRNPRRPPGNYSAFPIPDSPAFPPHQNYETGTV